MANHKKQLYVCQVDENGDPISSSSSVITDIEDGTGDSVMDAANNSIKVTVVSGGGSSVIDDIEDGTGDSIMDAANNAVRANVVVLPTGSVAGATVKTADFDTGVGTDTVAMFGVALPKSGGSVAGGTSTDPIRTDPTGTTAQPVTDNGSTLSVDDGAGSLTVDGTVTVQDGGGSISVDDNAGSLTVDSTQLPAALVSGRLDVNIGASSATVPVSDAGGNLSIDDGGNSITVDGTVTVNAGTNLNTSALALEAGGNLAGTATSLAVIDDWDESDRAKVNPIVGQAGVAGNTGTVGATTQRVTLATDVALPTGTNSMGRVVVGGVSKQLSASFTRPNDTTAYAAGDAVTDSTSAPTAITFDGCARANAGTGFVYGALMLDSANQATKAVFELWLFAGASAPTPDNDNAVFTPTDAELANLVAVIPLFATYVGDATSGAGGNAIYESPEIARPFTCGASVDDLFGLLVVRNAYTPVAQEIFTIMLRISQN